MTTFSEMGLAEPIARALAEDGYATPTPIQAQAIPYALEGRDLLGIAQTGTGKTLAFAGPILHGLASDPRRPEARKARVLVLAPTRELAGQINQSFRTYGRHLKLSTLMVCGGVKIGGQIRTLERGVDVLVATPGRLIDLIEQRAVSLDRVDTLVLDEADQMLDLGFIHALRRIATLLPKARQTLFFSATMPKAIADLAAAYLRDPVRVSVTPQATTAERVEQHVMLVPQAAKTAALVKLLDEPTLHRVLVFTRTKHGADRVVKHLERARIEAAAIHGNKSQPQRERALAAFKADRLRVLVATDIAARGLDIDGLSHVVNYEIPNVPEQYVHRIGRTGRAGAAGAAISLVADDERGYLRDIERLIRKPVPRMAPPAGLDLAQPANDEAARPARPPHRNGKPGHRKGPSPNRGEPSRRTGHADTAAGEKPGAPKPGNHKPRRRRRPHGAAAAA